MRTNLTARFYYVIVLSCVTAMTSSDSEYVGEVRVVLDKAGVQKWAELTGRTLQDLRMYLIKTFREITGVYFESLLQYNLHVDLVIKDIIILDYNLEATYRNDKINCMKLIRAFDNWVTTNNTEDVNKAYDLSILFTGYDMYYYGYREGDETTGISHPNTVCFPSGLGIVELSATSNDAFIASHEIAHILGAAHDGLAMTSSCNTEDGYVMSQTPNVTTISHLYFSPCSAQMIHHRIQQMNLDEKNCLAYS